VSQLLDSWYRNIYWVIWRGMTSGNIWEIPIYEEYTRHVLLGRSVTTTDTGCRAYCSCHSKEVQRVEGVQWNPSTILRTWNQNDFSAGKKNSKARWTGNWDSTLWSFNFEGTSRPWGCFHTSRALEGAECCEHSVKYLFKSFEIDSLHNFPPPS
jgi:hypothetical protein